MKIPTTKGYYYKHVSTNGNKTLYEQYDRESEDERFVAYELWKSERFWKTTLDFDRAHELLNRKEEWNR